MSPLVNELTIATAQETVWAALTKPDASAGWSTNNLPTNPQELETLWYLGGLRIIQALTTQPKRTATTFEYIEPAGTTTTSFAPTQEDTAFYIIEGEALFFSGEAIIHATPGTFLFLPRPVGFRSVISPSAPARLLTWTTPLGFAQQVTCMGNPGQPFVLSPPQIIEREKVQQLATLLTDITLSNATQTI